MAARGHSSGRDAAAASFDMSRSRGSVCAPCAVDARKRAVQSDADQPSIFNGQTLSDFIDPLVERIEAGMKASVLQVENIAKAQKSENPVVTFHIDEHLLDRVTGRSENTPQSVHRIPRLENMTL
jgi:hypothetical protein